MIETQREKAVAKTRARLEEEKARLEAEAERHRERNEYLKRQMELAASGANDVALQQQKDRELAEKLANTQT